MRRSPNEPTPLPLGVPLRRLGVEEGWWSRLSTDAYHSLRGSSWWQLFALFAAVYLLLNLFFASVLYFGDAALLNAEPGFLPRFVFSVQTMATIGYGHLAPADLLAHAVVTVESFVGVLYTAVVTGVFYSKFSTPRARVLFSRVCVVHEDGGVPTLQFRCGNGRSTALVEASVKVSYLRDERTEGGGLFRRIHDLELRRSSSPFFAASWTVIHPIVPGSPLFGRSPGDLEREAGVLMVTFTGLDDALVSTVHARHAYVAGDVRWDHRFVDMLGVGEDGVRYVDFGRLHDVRPVASTPGQTGAAG